MVWNLDPIWLALAISVVGIFSFIVSMALNAVMGDDGFGASGNAVVLSLGFFGGVIVAEWLGFRFRDLSYVVAFGLCGALACLAVLAGIKAALSRL